jgi:hypothetical protein
MNKFRVNKPLSNLNNEQNIKLQNFTNGANEHKVDDLNLNPKAKPSKSFTVPLNEYELLLLQQLSQNLDRSQRYVSRMLLVKALEKELDIEPN